MIIEVCGRVCRVQNAALIIGAGTNNTQESTAALAEIGRADPIAGALVPVPYFTRPSEAGVIAHFTHLATASPVPLIMYHVPYRTGQSLGAASLRAMGRLPGIVGVKYSPGVINQDTVDLLGDLPPDFTVLAGDDPLLSPLLALGAAGGIKASAHLATAPFVELATAWQSGNLPRAQDLGPALARLSAAAFAEPNPTVIKGALHAQGRIPTPDVRLPLLAASRRSVDETLQRLADLGSAVQIRTR